MDKQSGDFCQDFEMAEKAQFLEGQTQRASSLRQKDWSGFPGYESEYGPESVRTEQKT